MARPRKLDQLHSHESAPICTDQIVHINAVRNARQHLPTVETVAIMANLFSALGDPTRLRIVAALAAQELCVCDLTATLGMSQSAISHQLRVLRDLGLVRPRRDGRMTYYQLDDDHVVTLFHQASEHAHHLPKTSTQQDHRA